MTRTRDFCGAGLATVLLLTGCRERIGTGWDWNRMREQPKVVAFGASGAFADSMGMRQPPPGTVPYGEDSGVGAPGDPLRGADRFHIYCAVCHGERGDGQSLVARNMDPPKPPSLLTDTIRAMTADRLDQVIVAGYGRMPAFGGTLSAADRRAIRAYILTLQQQAGASHR